MNDRIGTFLLTTREGGRGVVRVFPEIGESSSRRLQYRMFESVKHPLVESLMETVKPKEKSPFDKTVTITLPLAKVGAECLLNLETEQSYPLPARFETALSNLFRLFREKNSAEWCRERGVDLVATSNSVPDNIGVNAEQVKQARIGFMVIGRNMRVIRLLPKSFYRLDVEDVQELLNRVDSDRPSVALMEFEPVTAADVEAYAIHTSGGMIGLIKLEQLPDEPNKIQIRYRLHATGKKSE